MAVQLSANFRGKDGTAAATVTDVQFTVQPAKLTSASLTYNKTVYDRHNWYTNIRTYDARSAGTNLQNVLTVKTAPADLPKTKTQKVLTLNDGVTGEYAVNKVNLTGAGSYTVTWTLKDTTNYIFDTGRERVLGRRVREGQRAGEPAAKQLSAG